MIMVPRGTREANLTDHIGSTWNQTRKNLKLVPRGIYIFLKAYGFTWNLISLLI